MTSIVHRTGVGPRFGPEMLGRRAVRCGDERGAEEGRQGPPRSCGVMPEAWEDSPWGDSVVKVGKKIFVFHSRIDSPETTWSMSVKLPISSTEALATTTSVPTG